MNMIVICWCKLFGFLVLNNYKVCRRQCLNELQKEYCVKTKVIALDGQWVTLRLWCQMNRNGHSSPVKHKVEGKKLKILGRLKITSGKSTLFGIFLWSIFMSPVFTSVFLYKWHYPYTSHMADFVLILTSLYCWIFGGSALVLGHASEKEKKQERQVGFKER